ncbi:hypothetical protein HHK36_004781 [Tetracentron sinense]|uniref:Transmembrane protein n=1 Tax=Tetracentron sinense TaxID=13715 RepID=A0A834ZKH7_TETSI|nr:hypothetical protein HHK36_004781 [Tetracentron sinense]
MKFLSIMSPVFNGCISALIYIAMLIAHLWTQDGQNVETKGESTDNIPAIEQTEIDIPDTLFLHHRIQSENRESAPYNFSPWFLRELMEEETISRAAIRVLEVASQPSLTQRSQESEPVVTVEIEFKTEFKVACWMLTISAGGIISLLAGLPGNEKAALTHKIFFKGYTALVYASVISSLGLFFLTNTRPNIPGLAIIVKFIMWVALGSATYALGFAMCILLLNSLVAHILVLVAPLVLSAVAVILNFTNCRN